MNENSGNSYLLALVIVIAAIALLSLPTAVLLNFFGVVDWLSSSTGNTDESRSAVLRNVALMFSAPLAALGVWIAWRRNLTADEQTTVSQKQLGQQMKQSNVQSRQYELAERSHDHGRYENGVALLGNASIVQQLSGVSVLRTLAQERRKQFDNQISTLFAELISNTTPLDAIEFMEGLELEEEHLVNSRTKNAIWDTLFDPTLEQDRTIFSPIRIHSSICPISLFGDNINREVRMENVIFDMIRICNIPSRNEGDIPLISFRKCYIPDLELIGHPEIDDFQLPMFIGCRIGDTVIDEVISSKVVKQLFANCTDLSGNRFRPEQASLAGDAKA